MRGVTSNLLMILSKEGLRSRRNAERVSVIRSPWPVYRLRHSAILIWSRDASVWAFWITTPATRPRTPFAVLCAIRSNVSVKLLYIV
jgi:hypothetical protein